jgi:hypothetical protein
MAENQPNLILDVANEEARLTDTGRGHWKAARFRRLGAPNEMPRSSSLERIIRNRNAVVSHGSRRFPFTVSGRYRRMTEADGFAARTATAHKNPTSSTPTKPALSALHVNPLISRQQKVRLQTGQAFLAYWHTIVFKGRNWISLRYDIRRIVNLGWFIPMVTLLGYV